jgi:hypothetical protein
MSTSTVTLTINPYPNGRSNDFNHVTISGKVAIGAGDYPANGLPVSWATMDPPAGPTPIKPAHVESVSSGYVYRHDPVHGTIRIFQSAGSAAPLVEIATTTPGGVVSDTIYFDAVFNRAG